MRQLPWPSLRCLGLSIHLQSHMPRLLRLYFFVFRSWLSDFDWLLLLCLLFLRLRFLFWGLFHGWLLGRLLYGLLNRLLLGLFDWFFFGLFCRLLRWDLGWRLFGDFLRLLCFWNFFLWLLFLLLFNLLDLLLFHRFLLHNHLRFFLLRLLLGFLLDFLLWFLCLFKLFRLLLRSIFCRRFHLLLGGLGFRFRWRLFYLLWYFGLLLRYGLLFYHLFHFFFFCYRLGCLLHWLLLYGFRFNWLLRNSRCWCRLLLGDWLLLYCRL